VEHVQINEVELPRRAALPPRCLPRPRAPPGEPSLLFRRQVSAAPSFPVVAEEIVAGRPIGNRRQHAA
jgi:hypothetical protein